MTFHLMHLHDGDFGVDPEEEAVLITPGTTRTAIAVPLDALPRMVELLGDALEDMPEQRCAHCGEALVRPRRTGG